MLLSSQNTSGEHVTANFHFTEALENGFHGKYIGYGKRSIEQGSKVLLEKLTVRQRLVRDARSFAEYSLKLSTVGFELVTCESSKCIDFNSREQLLGVYIPEVEAIVRRSVEHFLPEWPSFKDKVVRATRVWDICLRRGGQCKKPIEVGTGIYELSPLQVVHCDFYGKSVCKTLHHLLHCGADTLNPCGLSLERENEPVDMSLYLGGALPVLSINVWRSIDRDQAVSQSPLAVCDPRTIAEDRRLMYEINCPDVVGEEARFLPGDIDCAHAEKWFYYPQMTHQECLLFFSQGFCLPSSKEDCEWYDASVPHASFELPNPNSDVPRRSIEARVFVFLE